MGGRAAAPPAAGGPFVIRPSGLRFLRRIWSGLVVAAYELVSGLGAAAVGLPRELLVLLLVPVPIAYLLLLHYLLTARVEVSDGLVTLRGFLGTRRRVATADVRDAAFRDVVGRGSERPLRYLLLIDRERRVVLKLYRDYWADADLQALLTRLGVNLALPREMLGHRQLQRQFPGAEPWPVRHPLVMATALVAVIGVVVIAAVTRAGG